jgi:sulfite exporter TauE/SafE
LLLLASQLFDLYAYIPDTSSVNYFSAILIWIIASFSTCLAITGWIVIGFSRFLDKWHWFLGHLKVQTSFQIWRLVGFFIFWWILGYFGSFLNINFTINAVLTILVGFLLFYMWLNILWLVPSITKYWVHMPKSFVQKIEKLGQPKYAPIVWALTFFLPCWFAQTMQLLAIWSWSFLQKEIFT